MAAGMTEIIWRADPWCAATARLGSYCAEVWAGDDPRWVVFPAGAAGTFATTPADSFEAAKSAAAAELRRRNSV